jgi:hypothetical protein
VIGLGTLTEKLIEAIANRAAELALEKLSARMPAASPQAGRVAAMHERDLEAEIATLLAARPGLTVLEIGRALHTRDQTIRDTLETSPRFTSRSGLPGRSPKAKGWFLATDSSPTDPASRTSPLDSASQGTLT